MDLFSDNEKVKYEHWDSFIRYITLYKDYGFEEEREIRVIALPSYSNKSNRNKPRRFRCKNSEQLPYIELFKSSKYLPINKIIVGPHKDKEARAAWLRIKLDSMGRDDIEVAVSQIPFVGR